MRLRVFEVGVVLGLGVVALGGVGAGAQVQGRPGAYAGLDGNGGALTVEAALRSMSEQAAVIFVGTVISVERVGGDGFSAQGVVEIRFAVEQALRGCAGGSYTLREWGGLWAATDQRYRTGARLLMLLHAPGATGLSSPVGGLDGAIPVRASHGRVSEADAGETSSAPVVDLRWLAARLVRSTGYGQPAAAASGVASPRALATRLAEPGIKASAATPVAVAEQTAALRSVSTPAAQASVTTVVGLMSGWAKETADAR